MNSEKNKSGVNQIFEVRNHLYVHRQEKCVTYLALIDLKLPYRKALPSARDNGLVCRMS